MNITNAVLLAYVSGNLSDADEQAITDAMVMSPDLRTRILNLQQEGEECFEEIDDSDPDDIEQGLGGFDLDFTEENYRDLDYDYDDE